MIVKKVSWSLSNSNLPEVKNKPPGVRVLAFLASRQNSHRFPNKIYADLNGAPLIFHVISRTKEAKLIDDVVVCSPHKLPDLPEGTKEFVFWGDENDVLDRFVWCLKYNPCDFIVRVTHDCPLLDPKLINYIVYEAIAESADYCSNVLKLTFPDGVDTEVISANLLRFMGGAVKTPYNREHVTTLIRDSKDLQDQFKCVSIENDVDLSKIKISIDTPEELQQIRNLYKE